MTKAMIVIDAARVEWTPPVPTAAGGLRQEVRIHDDTECKVVLYLNFPSGSPAVKAWEEQGGELRPLPAEANVYRSVVLHQPVGPAC